MERDRITCEKNYYCFFAVFYDLYYVPGVTSERRDRETHGVRQHSMSLLFQIWSRPEIGRNICYYRYWRGAVSTQGPTTPTSDQCLALLPDLTLSGTRELFSNHFPSTPRLQTDAVRKVINKTPPLPNQSQNVRCKTPATQKTNR